MLEVHPPHQAAHSWRDFFIHIATICVGLLIAVGLEQTVELIHHSHQRHQLREDLHLEMLANQRYLQHDYEYARATRDWAAAQSQAIQDAIASHTTQNLVYQPPPADFDLYVLPNDSVWQHASESGTASLLPRDEAQSYTLLFRFRSRFLDTYKQLFDARYSVVASGLRFASGNSTTPNFQRMTPAQLEDYSVALSKEATALNTNLVFCGFMAGAQRALLDGSTMEADLVHAMTDNRNPYHGWPVPHSAAAPQFPSPSAVPSSAQEP